MFSAVRIIGRSDFVGRIAFGKMRSVSGAISERGTYGEIAEMYACIFINLCIYVFVYAYAFANF